MSTNKTFALIDNASGYIWLVCAAESAEAACAAATTETGGDVAQYEQVNQLAGNEGGYIVYEAPAGFDVQDGQSQDEIASVSAMPLIGKFRAIN